MTYQTNEWKHVLHDERQNETTNIAKYKNNERPT